MLGYCAADLSVLLKDTTQSSVEAWTSDPSILIIHWALYYSTTEPLRSLHDHSAAFL